MEILHYNFIIMEEFNESYHHLYFTVGGVAFKAIVVENIDETYVEDAFIKVGETHYQVIDILSFFGTGFSSHVFNFIYNNLENQHDRTEYKEEKKKGEFLKW